MLSVLLSLADVAAMLVCICATFNFLELDSLNDLTAQPILSG